LKVWIHAEFFVNYFVTLPLMQRITGTAFFGGSNGVWLTDSLRSTEFDRDVLTEDIDCAVRCLTRRGTPLQFRFLPQCRSGELAPVGLRALWKQRLRWTMGWDEATLKHWPTFYGASGGWFKGLGLLYIFIARWFSLFFTFFIVIINTVMSWAAMSGYQVVMPTLILQIQVVSFVCFVAMILFAFGMALLYERSARLLLGLIVYFWLNILALVFNTFLSVVSLVSLATGNRGGWVVTQRPQSSTMSISQEPLQEPLLQEPLLQCDEKVGQQRHRELRDG